MNRTDWLDSLADSASPDIDECIEMLGDLIPWLHLLESTEQDSEWHAEGNVHRHTGMVLTELYRLLTQEAKHIDGWKRQAIIIAALLHDIAKPVRTRRFDLNGIERVGAPQHAKYGRSYLAFKLPELKLPFEVIWTILNLVGEHHTPKRLVINNSPRHEYYSLARQADTELLYWLEVADIRGRICPDPAVQIQVLEEFRMFAEDYHVWGTSLHPLAELAHTINQLSSSARDYVYAHAIRQLESGKIYLAQEAVGTTYQHREKHSHLVVLCGPSGSGKTRWRSINYPGYTLISLDDLRQQFNGDSESQKNKGQILQQSKNLLRAALRIKDNVIWDATNLRTDFRSVICGLGRDYHALTTLTVFLCPEEKIHINNRGREHRVPNDVLQKQLSNYQLPLLSEAHQYQVIDQNGKVQFRSGYPDEAPTIVHRLKQLG